MAASRARSSDSNAGAPRMRVCTVWVSSRPWSHMASASVTVLWARTTATCTRTSATS